MEYAAKKKRPVRSKEQVSSIMSKIHSRDTAIEVSFRKALWAKGLRYSLNSAKLPGKPDIVLSSRRVAIFIDGDYWHGGQWYRRNHASLEDQYIVSDQHQKEYWTNKIRKNMNRDCATTDKLLSGGWRVLRFWESEIKTDLDACVERVFATINNGINPTSSSILPQKTVAEFFAGIGLMRLGLEKQGWSVSYANDIDADKHEIYLENFNDTNTHFHLGDIHAVDVDTIPQITLATASFPCNDLSLAGARKGLEGKQSSAFWGFIRVLKESGDKRPPLVLLENVPGFLTSHQGEDFHNALSALNQLGYVVDTFMLDAVNFVPQSRKRLFIVAMREDGNRHCRLDPGLTLVESDVRPRVVVDFILDHPQIQWSIRHLPRQPQRFSELRDIVEDLSPDAPEWWPEDRAAYLLSQMSGRHTETAQRMIAAQDWSYGTVFRRVRNGRTMAELRTDGVAGCLRTPRGGSGRQILFKAGKGKYFVRLLTPRECARLMGASGFKTSVPLNQALFGYGDAVCVPVIEWIAKHYLNPVVNELMHGKPLIMRIQGDCQ